MFVNLLERTSSLLGLTDRIVGIACGAPALSRTASDWLYVRLMERVLRSEALSVRPAAFDPSGRFFEDGTGDLEPLRCVPPSNRHLSGVVSQLLESQRCRRQVLVHSSDARGCRELGRAVHSLRGDNEAR